MAKPELETLRNYLQEEIARRANLGGYNQDAEPILRLHEIVLALVEHATDMQRGILETRRMARRAASGSK